MKKIISLILALAMMLGATLTLSSCNLFGGDDAIYVQTNAYFAPFEYYDGSEIVGVDVEIMEMVGEKLGKDIVWQDGDFGDEGTGCTAYICAASRNAQDPGALQKGLLCGSALHAQCTV